MEQHNFSSVTPQYLYDGAGTLSHLYTRVLPTWAIKPPKWPIITKQGDTTYPQRRDVTCKGHERTLNRQEVHTMTSTLQYGLSPCESRHKYLSFVGEFVSQLWLKYLDTWWCIPPDIYLEYWGSGISGDTSMYIQDE